MMAAPRTVTAGVPIILTVLLLSSEGHDVQRGSDIASCSMKCPDEKAVLNLYTVCGGNETLLAALWCDTMWSGNDTEPRFYLDTSSGCWTLKDARKEDSCVYRTVQHNRELGTTSQTDLTVSVTDPEYSQLRFPAVIGGILFVLLILLIVLLVKCYKKMKVKDVENDGGNDHSEEHGRQNGSSADTDREKKTGQKNLINTISRLCGNHKYEETPQMEERRRVTPPEVAQN